jgi:hypothetical protein
MPYPIDFSRDACAGWIEAIERGSPLMAPDGRWIASSVVSLTGTLFVAAMSQGPPGYMQHRGRLESLPREHREAVEETFFVELHGAIELCVRLAATIKDGKFDESFEPRVLAWVQQRDGYAAIVPCWGFRR